ncbi:MAG: flagellar basal body-associated FliL family protein [Nitrospinota bacterium]|nr:flagellar basal body-associated FliL family protein [Nitrospinota bacterium]
MAEDQQILESDHLGAPPRNILLNIVLVILLVLIAGAGGYFFQKFISEEESSMAPSPVVETPAVANQTSPAVGVMVPLEPFMVNLAKTKGSRILKVTVTLELNNPAVRPEVEDNRQKIMDSILVLLSSKTFEDVYSIQGKFKLKDEITTRVNRFLALGHVREVYFSEFLIQ